MNSLKNFLIPGRVSCIVGGQFGSEAKGLAAAIVASHIPRHIRPNLICTTNAGAQAGHTTVLEDGRKFVCYHLPTIGVLVPESRIYINAGSIIDPYMLWREIIDVSSVTGESPEHLSSRITVHPHAAVITNIHKQLESTATQHLGSTQKGVGAALADKIMRKPGAVVGTYNFSVSYIPSCPLRPDRINLNTEMLDGMAVSVEIPQGTGLSINNGRFYPQCTSRDCWVGQGLADAGIHPQYLYNTLMVQRTFPIRVGHIYDQDTGFKVGDSGNFYPDSRELDWATDFPGIEPERTTVTKRVRRIATFSVMQYREVIELNRPTIVLNTFMNYLKSRQAENDHMKPIIDIDHTMRYYPKHLWSYGPKVSDTLYNPREA